MTLERWIRGEEETGAFDWRRPARELDVPLELARSLYLRAMQRAMDLPRIEALYLAWLRTAAEARRPAAPPPAPGRRTQVSAAQRGAVAAPDAEELRRLGPGKWTRSLLEGRDDEAAAVLDRAAGTVAGRTAGPGLGLPGLDDVHQAIAALSSAAREAGEAPVAPVAPIAAGAAARMRNSGAASLAPWASGRAVEPGRDRAAALREQLQAAATAGQSARDALAAADPDTAAAALRALRAQGAPLLRLVAQSSGGEVERVLGRGSPGAALPAELAAKLSPHVGASAAGTARIHTGDAAELVADAHHARALTVGSDIYFARGEFAPGTERGDELITHELTHVAQGQRGELDRAAAKGITGGTNLDPSEAEADLRARLAVIDLHAPAGAAPPLASPSGQPTSDGERQSKIAAQQQRLSLAGQGQQPLAMPQAPPASSAQGPVPHQPPAMKPAPAAASTGNAYVDTFNAPPSKQATDLWGKAGTSATTQTAADQAKFDAALPPMPVNLDGSEGKGGKGGAPAGKAPGQPPPKGATPPAATPTPTPATPPVTAGAAAAQQFQVTADKAQMKADGAKVLDNLPTTPPDVKTDPGPAPVTDLAGQADPVRTVGDHQHAITESAKALDSEKQKVIAGPGAAAVQPVKLDQKLDVPKEQAAGAMPQLPTVEGMGKFKKYNLPTNVQTSFDTLARPKMDASLAQGKAKMLDAEHKRDADRSKAVTDAQDKVKTAHTDADKQQQQKVADARTQISNHQANTLVKHEAEIKKLDQQSGTKKDAAIGKINSRIAADQAKVQGDYADAQKKAEDKKQQGEQDAKKKKEDAEKKKKDESFWDKVGDEISDGIKAIADEIDHALEAIGKAIGEIIDTVKNAACAVIDAARDFVCQALTEFGDWLKSAVTALIGSVFPELAAELNRLIDAAVNAAKAAVNAIADGLKKAVTALCDSIKGALDAIIAAFRAAVQAAAAFAQALVTGDWAAVGKMILEGILKLLGIDPGAFYALIGKAEDSIEKIIENPGAFVGHLIDAVKLGFKQFGANFWTHLKDGLVQWLFGTFASAGIHMPASFDIAGIFDLVCQVLGLTWPKLKLKIAKVIGEKNTERLEFAWGYIQALITGGFHGLWEKVKQDMSGLWDMVINGVKDWIIQKVVQQAVIKIATMWNPAGAIIQLIETAWNVYCWVKENAQRIFGLVQAVVDSISNIVAGNIGGAANFIEDSLAKLVPVAISLFANLLGLGGIADKIRGIIEKVQTTVDQAIDKLIARVMGMFKGKDKDDKDGRTARTTRRATTAARPSRRKPTSRPQPRRPSSCSIRRARARRPSSRSCRRSRTSTSWSGSSSWSRTRVRPTRRSTSRPRSIPSARPRPPICPPASSR
jgi:phage-related protein